MNILYHKEKVDVVKYSLSKKVVSVDSLALLLLNERLLAMDVLANRFVKLDISKIGRFLSCIMHRHFMWSRLRLGNLKMKTYA